MAQVQDVGIRAVIENYNEFVAGMSKMQRSFGGFVDTASQSAGRVSSFGQAVSNVSDKLVSVGKTLTASITLPLVTLGTVALKSAIDYETAFAGVAKTNEGIVLSVSQLEENIRSALPNISEEELAQRIQFLPFSQRLTEEGKALEEALRNLSLQIPLPATELAHIAEIAGQLGIANESLVGFTEAVAGIGVSTELGTEQASLALGKLATVFGIPADAADDFALRVGGAVVALGNNLATTETPIVNFAARVAGTFSALQIPIEYLLGLGAAVTATGTQVEAGGSSIQTALLTLSGILNGSEQGFIDNTAALEAAGNAVSDLGAKIESAQAQLEAATTVTAQSDAQSALSGYTQELELLNSEIEVLTATNGLPATSAEMGVLAEITGLTTDQLKAMWQDGIAPTGEQLELGAARGQLFIQFIEGLAAEGETASVVLEELGIGGIRSVKTFLGLSGGIEQVGLALGLASEQMRLTDEQLRSENALLIEAGIRYSTTASQVQLLKNTITNLSIVIGSQLLPVVVPVAQKIASVFTDLVKRFELLEPARKAAILFGSALVAGVGPAITLIGSLAGVLGGLTTFFSGLGFVGGGIVAGLGLLIGQSIQLNGGLLSTVIGFVRELYDWLTAKMPVGGITELMFNLLQDTPGTIEITPTINPTNYIAEIQGFVGRVQGILAPVVHNIQSIASLIFAGFRDSVLAFSQGLKSIPLGTYLTDMLVAFNDVFLPALLAGFESVDNLMRAGLGQDLVNQIVSIVAVLGEVVSSGVVNGLQLLADNMGYFISVVQTLVGVVSPAIAGFSSMFRTVMGELGRIFEETSQTTSAFFVGLSDNFLRLVSILSGERLDFGGTLSVVVTSLSDAVIVFVNTVLPAVLTKITAFVDYIAREVPRLADNLRQFFAGEFLTHVQTFANFIATNIDDIVKAFGLLVVGISALEKLRDIGLFLQPFNSALYNIELTLHTLGQVSGYASGALNLLLAPLSAIIPLSKQVVVGMDALAQSLSVSIAPVSDFIEGWAGIRATLSDTDDDLSMFESVFDAFQSDVATNTMEDEFNRLFDGFGERMPPVTIAPPIELATKLPEHLDDLIQTIALKNEELISLFADDRQLKQLIDRYNNQLVKRDNLIAAFESGAAAISATFQSRATSYSSALSGLYTRLADLERERTNRRALDLPTASIGRSIESVKRQVAEMLAQIGALGAGEIAAIKKLETEAAVPIANLTKKIDDLVGVDIPNRLAAIANKPMNEALSAELDLLVGQRDAMAQILQGIEGSAAESLESIIATSDIAVEAVQFGRDSLQSIAPKQVGVADLVDVDSKVSKSGFRQLLDGLKSAFASAGAIVVAGLVSIGNAILHPITSIKTVLVGLGGTIGSVFGSVGSAIYGAISGVAGALFSLLNPITIAIGAIVGGLVALGAAAANIDFRNVFTPLFSGDVAGSLDAIRVGFANLGDGIKTGFGSVLAFISPLLQAFQSLGNSFGSLSQLGVPLGDLFNKLAEIGDILGPRLLVIAGVLGGVLLTALTAVVSAIAGMLPGIIQVIGGLTEIVTGVISIFGGLAETILGVFNYIFTGSSDQLKRGGLLLIDGFKQAFGGIADVVLGSISAVLGGVTGFVEGIALSIGAFASALGNSAAGEWFLRLAETARQAVFIIQYAFQWLSDVLVGHSIIPDMITAMLEWFTLSSIITAVSQAIPQIVAQFVVLGVNALLSVQQFVADMIQTGYDWTTGIAQGLIMGGANLVLSLIDVLGQAVEAGKNFLQSHSPSQLAATELGIPISEGVAYGIDTSGYLIGDSLVGVTGQGFSSAYEFGMQAAQQFGAKLASAIGQSVITGSAFDFGSAQAISRLIPESALSLLSDFNQEVLTVAVSAGVTADEFIALGLQAGISVDTIKSALEQAALDKKLADLQTAVANGKLSFEQAQLQYEQFADSLATGIGLTVEVDQANYLAARATFEQLKAEGVEVIIRPVLGETADLRGLLPTEELSGIADPIIASAEQLQTAAEGIIIAGIANTLTIAQAGVDAQAAIQQMLDSQTASGREGGLMGGGVDTLTPLANIERLRQEYLAIDDIPLAPAFDLSGIEAFSANTTAVFNTIPSNIQPAFDQISANFGVELAEMTAATSTWATGVSTTIAQSFNVGGFTLAMGMMRQTAQTKLAEILTLFSTTLTSVSLAISLSSITIQQAFTVLLGAIVTTVRNNEIASAWSGVGVELAAGVLGWTSLILSAIDSLIGQVVTQVSNTYQQFYETGAYIIAGLAAGIASMATLVANESAAVAQGAVEAAQDVTQTESPSRVMYELGRDMDRGLVNGLQAGAREVADTVTNVLGGAIEESANNAEYQILMLNGRAIEASADMLDRSMAQTYGWVDPRALDEVLDAVSNTLNDNLPTPSGGWGQGMANAIGEIGDSTAVNNAIETAVDEMTNTIEDALSSWIDTHPLDEIFGLADAFSSAGSSFADLFTSQVLDPIQEQMDELGELTQDIFSDLLDSLGLDEETLQAALDAGGVIVLEPRFEFVSEQLSSALNDWDMSEGELQDIFDDLTRNFTVEELASLPDDLIAPMAQQMGLTFSQLQSIIDSIVASTSLTGEEQTMLDQYLIAQQERNALEQEFIAQQERVLALQEQQQKLDFLKQQFDLIKALTEAGLDPAAILDGITLGLDASVPDLIEAMTVALQALVQAANEELEIGSPSKVFTVIGGQMMAGIDAGISGATNSTMGYMAHAMSNIASTQYQYPPVAGVYNQSTSVDKSVTINVDAHYAKQQLPGHIGADIAALMYNVVW